jgi:hypothetical protein
MEVGQGPNWGCSAKEKNAWVGSPSFFLSYLLIEKIVYTSHFPIHPHALHPNPRIVFVQFEMETLETSFSTTCPSSLGAGSHGLLCDMKMAKPELVFEEHCLLDMTPCSLVEIH